MMGWIRILTAIVIVLMAGVVYMIAAIGRFRLLRDIRRPWLRRLLSFGLLALGFLVCALAMSLMNAVVVFLYVLIFFLIFGLLFRLVKKATGKTFRIYWQGWLALLTSAVYLCVGYWLCFHVFRTEYTLYSDKISAPVRIAVFADSHIGTTFDGEGFAKRMEEIAAQHPDAVLIVGDYVDDSTKREDMVRACEALECFDAPYGVWFVYGNHDKGYYRGRDFSADELASELEKHHVRVLEDETACVGELCIAGRKDFGMGFRQDIDRLLYGVDREKYIIVLDHEPADYEREAESAADLVLSGHTHGGQLIPINAVGRWLGINDRTYGHERRNTVDFIVTSGISDWELYFKTGTKSEYVIIRLLPDRT